MQVFIQLDKNGPTITAMEKTRPLEKQGHQVRGEALKTMNLSCTRMLGTTFEYSLHQC